jgi:galactofuranosylgalactofuranosylrhamnosyl-N-acetylglucosaminyl-diphospho-decaprenol beta-1,5/1,6-galactofuranosyltransferase
MNPQTIPLQRIRFYAMDERLIASNVTEFVPRFSFESWKDKGQSVYWKSEAESIRYLKDSLELTAGQSVSSNTFFNSFFLAYWLRLTRLKTLFLQIKTRGKFRLEMIQHTVLGEEELVVSREITDATDIELSPSAMPAAIRLSFTLTALEDKAQLLDGSWRTKDSPDPLRLGIVIATFGRDIFAERLIHRILDDTGLQSEDIRLVVTDQNPVSKLGHLNQARCRIVTQNNLGNPGGLTRSLYEMLHGENRFDPTHVMFIDDDVDLETDSILRSIRLQQFAKTPFIIGGIMLDLYRPDHALCHGENLSPNDEGVRSLRRNFPDTDISDTNGLNSFSIPSDYDYSAGWFCVFPAEVYANIGYQIPFFIQGYEDAQFCLRAREIGYLTYTIPGVGVWHLPFYSKKTADWKLAMSNYHQMVHHCLYGHQDCAGFFFQVGTSALQELLQGRYRHAAALVRAMENFLNGWSYFTTRTYPAYLQELQTYLSNYDADQQPPGVIKKAQVGELKRRLENAIKKFESDGGSLQSCFASKLPETYAMDSWKHYFARGNLSALAS